MPGNLTLCCDVRVSEILKSIVPTKVNLILISNAIFCPSTHSNNTNFFYITFCHCETISLQAVLKSSKNAGFKLQVSLSGIDKIEQIGIKLVFVRIGKTV
jgi:hypothetical protein